MSKKIVATLAVVFALAVAAQAATVVEWTQDFTIDNQNSGNVMTTADGIVLYKLHADRMPEGVSWDKTKTIVTFDEGIFDEFGTVVVACQKVNEELDGETVKGYFTAELDDADGVVFDFGGNNDIWVDGNAYFWTKDVHECVTVTKVDYDVAVDYFGSGQGGKVGNGRYAEVTVTLTFTMSDGTEETKNVFFENVWIGSGSSPTVYGATAEGTYDFDCVSVTVSIILDVSLDGNVLTVAKESLKDFDWQPENICEVK